MRSAKPKQFLVRVYCSAAIQRGVKAAVDLSGRDRRIISAYLRQARTPRLHIGCGHNPIAGWLNTDYPIRPTAFTVKHRIVTLDATKRFPFPDGSFDYVKSEHMIEHVPYSGGEAMIRECFRILKPGGRIRISTPALEFLLALMREPLDQRQRDYVEWSAGLFLHHGEPATPAAVVNNFMRDWGHQFIYDRKSFTQLLSAAGFVDIAPREINQSDDPELSGIDFPDRMPEGFLDLETMTYEARKPG